jgi:hypothetical protein
MDTLQDYARLFEHLSPEDLDRLGDYLAPEVRFKDPFNDVRGIEGVRRVFQHMFDTLQEPRFVVLDRARSAEAGYLLWRFDFRVRPDRPARTLEGMSRVRFNDLGKVVEHLDFWDPAEQLYSDVPVLGPVLRSLRRRLSAGS